MIGLKQRCSHELISEMWVVRGIPDLLVYQGHPAFEGILLNDLH